MNSDTLNASSETLNRLVPEAQFVTYIDETLGKADPRIAIPWTLKERPKWVEDFYPEVIWDIGCALGAFTESIIKSLAEWGCLKNLKQLILFEGDPNIHESGAEALQSSLIARVSGILASYKIEGVAIEVHITNVEFQQIEGTSEVSPIKPLYALDQPKADLVVASHLTYYFGDGSGQGLIQALQSHHLQPNGKIWCVIRNLECPIYLKRRETLKELNTEEPKPHDYAEYFIDKVIPEIKQLNLLVAQELGYNLKISDEWLKIGYVFMWREMPPSGGCETAYTQAVKAIAMEDDPLFKETHFILVNAQQIKENQNEADNHGKSNDEP